MLARFLALLSFSAVFVAPVLADERPNILLVFFDDMGWSDLGCYGGKVAATPNIDRFATEGMRFTDAYAAMPNCTPSRACLISGQASPRHGIYTVSPSPGKVAAKAEYEARQAEQWFTSAVNQHTLPATVSALPAELKRAGYETAFTGKWHHSPSPEDIGFEEVFREPRDKDDPKQMYGLTENAIKFITARKDSDKPWFFYLSHHVPHVRVEARRETLSKYEGLPEDSPMRPGYAAMIDDADTSFGQLMEALEASGQADNTLVVLFSDNGGYLRETSNAPLRDGKGTLYEGGIREPLIVRWPKVIEAGSTHSTPVVAMDLFPTFVDLAGGKMPAGQICDGVSLRPLLEGTTELDRNAIYWHFPHYNFSFGQRPCSVIRKGDHKLIHFYEKGRSELYDLASDLSESNDLSNDKPALVTELKTQLDTWIRDAGGFIPGQNPNRTKSSDR